MPQLRELELADHEDLLAHRGTGKSLYMGHLGDLELAVHKLALVQESRSTRVIRMILSLLY
jgi:hypothetical protein